MIIVRVMRGTRDLFIWGVRLLIGEIVAFIRNCSGHVYSGRTLIISSGKALYLELRPTMLGLAMVFVASNEDCFFNVRYLGCESICLPVDLLEYLELFYYRRLGLFQDGRWSSERLFFRSMK